MFSLRFVACALGLTFCLLLAPPADAKDEPLTPAQVVDAVLDAIRAKDEAKLRALAARPEPDAWLVADELLGRGKAAEAETFVKAAKGPTVAGLPAYIASRKGAEDDQAERETLDAILIAAGKGDWVSVLKKAGDAGSKPPKLDSVTRLRIAFARGIALTATRQRAEGARVLHAVGARAEFMGWLGIASVALHTAGREAYNISAWDQAYACWVTRLSVARKLGDRKLEAQTVGNLGNVHLNRGQYDEARKRYEESLAIKRELGDEAGMARTLSTVGIIERRLGNYDKAVALYREALDLARKLGQALTAAQALGNIGHVLTARGDFDEALVHHEESLRTFKALGRKASMGLALKSIGDVHFMLGQYEACLARRTEALKLFQEIGDRQHAARVVGSLGSVHVELGRYAQALAYYEEALEAARRLGDPTAEAAWLSTLGSVQGRLGNHAAALARYEESLALARRLKERMSIAMALVNIGEAQSSLGRYVEAHDHYAQALEIRRKQGDKAGVAIVLLNIGITHANQRDYALALVRHREALAAYRELKATPGVVRSLVGVGFAQRELGQLDEAAEAYEQAIEELGEGGNPADRSLALGGLAQVRLAQGRHADAVAAARQGIEHAAGLTRGLAEGEGAGTLDIYLSLFDAGMRAALASGDVATQTWMLEHGRAGTLREMLGSRRALQAAVVPPKLAKALTIARLTEARARQQTVRARRGGSLKRARQAKQALEQARAEVLAIVTRIQREAKAGASILLPSPDELSTIQARLKPGEAFVYYGLTRAEAFALVVERDAARMATLGSSREVRAAIDALLRDETPYIDPSAVDALRLKVVAPLKLPTSIRRVLVSPTGRLGYVPFALLLPEREVAFAPSGTTHGLLAQERDLRGDAVLAVGDPAYRDRKVLALHRGGAPLAFAPLPETRKEAEAIADVTLLGAQATEPGLAQAIEARERWRAVHLACHGWVDPERPLLSGLALTASAEHDGLLTCLDVFRMRIPADLVVLSACETGRGKAYATEGIIGLTRAFMFAGAPRVLCSLWKVDDEATRALMVKFYEIWAPKTKPGGVSAAAALRQAQEYVRTFEREEVDRDASRKARRTVMRKVRPWQHPQYWAAWVLWGLPD
ncbi:MAG: tetratricopeptide repeat protein [Planctomycetota bacterium]|nr:tetratricopeptide repeat protein [Planctomycetota bacterium]